MGMVDEMLKQMQEESVAGEDSKCIMAVDRVEGGVKVSVDGNGMEIYFAYKSLTESLIEEGHGDFVGMVLLSVLGDVTDE